MLPLDKIHNIIKLRTGMSVISGGQEDESPELPYIQYDLIQDKRYLNYQILSKTEEVPLPLPVKIITSYKNPTYKTYQYTVIGDPADEGSGVKQRMDELYNFLTTKVFKIAINDEGIFHTIMGPVTEINLNKEEFFEKRFILEIRWAFAELFEEDETSIGVIGTVESERIPAVAEL